MGWERTLKPDGETVELRKTFNGPVYKGKHGHMIRDYGQMLIIVSDGRVRMSMNGPCNMTDEEFDDMRQQVFNVQNGYLT